MFKHISTIVKPQAKRQYARVLAFAVCGLLLGASIVYLGVFLNSHAPPIGEQDILSHTESVDTATSTFARSAPKRLIIPKIELDTTFVAPLGLNTDKTIEVPDVYDAVGWYKNGATPGEVGPSVILGHVDSYQGPAIFYSLGQLEEGDEVMIEREDGTTAVFVVTHKERVSQDNFPTLRVYGPTEVPALRLVTCSGIYDRGALKYSHNLIVYGELKQEGE